MKTRLLLALALVASAAGPSFAQTMHMPARPAGSAAAMPLVAGEVRKLDPAAGLIVLRHGDIPNLGMPGMTMGFAVADKAMLDRVKVGDKVNFQAELVGGKATVTELHPAP